MNSKVKHFLINGLLVLAVIAVGLPLLRGAYRHFLKQSYPIDYEEIVTKYAQEYALPPSLIYGVIYTESRFQPDATSHAGAKGLMQLMDTTFDWTLSKLGEQSGDVFDPDTNIRCGGKLLEYLINRYDNTKTALAAYNAGMTNVNSWLKDAQYSYDGQTLHNIPFPETAEYVKRVLKAQNMYQELYHLT